MKILIAVPSKNRAVAIMKDTLRWLPETRYDWRVFVEPQDFPAYLAAGIPDDRLIQLKENNKGLGYAKKTIYDWAVEYKYDLIFKLDDDIKNWYGADRKRSLQPVAVFEKAIDDSIQVMKFREDVMAVSFPYSFQMFDAGKKWTNVNLRTQTAYIVRTNCIFPDERISVFEDFATFIFIRVVKNGLVLRYGLAGMDCADVGVNKGGHQEFNREEKAKAEIEYLREIYPALTFRPVKGKAWTIEPDMRNEVFAGKDL